MSDLRFRISQPATGREATLHWPGGALAGDPGLCADVAPFLSGPVLALRPTVDPSSRERGTRLVELSPGGEAWVRECLNEAAVRLDLRVVLDLW